MPIEVTKKYVSITIDGEDFKTLSNVCEAAGKSCGGFTAAQTREMCLLMGKVFDA